MMRARGWRLSIRSSTVRRLVRAEPMLLFRRGQYLDRAMRRERVTRDDMLAAIRSQGVVAIEDVEAVILAGDGGFSVVTRSVSGSASALDHVASSP